VVVVDAGTTDEGVDTMVVVVELDGGAVVDVVGETLECTVVGVTFVVGTVDGVVAALVVGVVDPVDGVQLDGGTPEPVWPGMSTVPAQPKLEKVAARVTVPPSAKVSTVFTWRMSPLPSMETWAVLAVKPCPFSRASAAVMVWDSALVVPAESAN
jgi:hypothetical protein